MERKFTLNFLMDLILADYLRDRLVFVQAGVERILAQPSDRGGIDTKTYMSLYTSIHNYVVAQKVTGTHGGKTLLADDLSIAPWLMTYRGRSSWRRYLLQIAGDTQNTPTRGSRKGKAEVRRGSRQLL